MLILGKAKSRADKTSTDTRLNFPIGEWIAKLFVIAILYVFIYFTFGYFIAWKSEAVRIYYGGNDPGSFFAHMASVMRSEPLLFLLQVVRGLLWAAIAVPVIRMMRGKWWEAGLAVALLFATASSLLLIPNPLMPPEVRMAHLIETVTSNFLFGWLLTILLEIKYPLRRIGIA